MSLTRYYAKSQSGETTDKYEDIARADLAGHSKFGRDNYKLKQTNLRLSDLYTEGEFIEMLERVTEMQKKTFESKYHCLKSVFGEDVADLIMEGLMVKQCFPAAGKLSSIA